jgi:hypothetical protein
MLSTWLTRERTASAESVAAAATVVGAGTVLMAWLVAPITSYPRSAWMIAAGLVGAGILVGALVTPDPAQWTRAMKPMIWLYPWYFLLSATVRPPRKGWCAPTSPWSGRVLVGAGAALGGMAALLPWLMSRF